MNDIPPFIENISVGIPVNNLWLLMLYASKFRYLIDEYGGTESIDEDVASLVADVLCSQVEARLKRNLTYGYKHSTRDLNRVRGRINVLETYSQQLLQKGKVSCTFEELSIDTPRNRYICAALKRIAGLVVKKPLKLRCYKLVQSMTERGVSPEFDISYHPKNERFGRHELADRKVLTTAELTFNLALLNESAANNHYASPDKQAEWVRKLFEKAVGGFYDLKLGKTWSVRPGKRLNWQIDEATDLIEKLMPSMELDILLENRVLGKRIVIDTKFTSITVERRFGGESFKSNYIYQLYTYLRSQELHLDNLSMYSSGVLLHPSIGVDFDEKVTIQGHCLRFFTVDLSKNAESIKARLNYLITSS
ncbi:5-methylcytosine-specific restriction endonuclease system specificity protein McrC [Pseudoalteromonas issachenkonii]|uniref:5-methylcytosine-specific restriction endonuclease system specificity protein McrC n=1 Tax=Pseudoalteromonas issachenkonii TaxID=152297 RepID=A0ABU9H1K3_9GAMM|nr:5-methylcytosine-specific restriction endonuclease system specificity protein McrC [Pseudoalteromonas distincta]MBD0410929.1 5-methylcytosine-specific restriction endonuclease system specificity protein McrC [Pseudoalteromonas distincta]